jgi:hypothetical protein
MMNENDIEAIRERFTRLEREVRLWKRAATATIVLLVALIAFSSTARTRDARAADSPTNDLVGRSLTIVDEQGNRLIRLDSIESTPMLALCDEKGTLRVSLAAFKDSPGLGVRDEKGTPRVTLVVGKDGPALGLSDEKGTRCVTLAADKDGTMLALGDEKGKPRAVFGSAQLENPRTGATEATGPSSVTLFDKAGKTIWRAP